jgi:VWFA-related protein
MTQTTRRIAAVALLATSALTARSAHAQSGTVRLFADVLDRTGKPILDLTATDFNVREDGVNCHVARARLATEPMRIALLVDNSDAALAFIKPMRSALAGFIDALPPQDEVALVTFGRQIDVRTPPTADRVKLKKSVASMTADEGSRTALIDSLLDAHKRFLHGVEDRWPVVVVVTSDQVEIARNRQTDFNSLVRELQATQAIVHAVVFSAGDGLFTSTVTRDLARNTGGVHESVSGVTGLAEKLMAVAGRITADQRRMALRYEVEYVSSSVSREMNVEVGVVREGATVDASRRRLP